MLEAGSAIRDGRYRIVRLLGEGSQGATFEAVDAREGRLVAVKRFTVRGAASWKDVELAEREARVLASLNHPLIPKVIEHFEESGELFLVTELVRGESLASIQRRGDTWTTDDTLRLLEDLASATDYLHARTPAIIHRDIKPSNVIRRDDGRYVLIDFGAVRAHLAPSGGSTVVGTFGFMAPEQLQGRALPQTDTYGIGATVLATLAGRDPEHLPHRGLAIDVRAALGPAARESLVLALQQMLAPDPDHRPATITPTVGWLRERQRLRREARERAWYGAASGNRWASHPAQQPPNRGWNFREQSRGPLGPTPTMARGPRRGIPAGSGWPSGESDVPSRGAAEQVGAMLSGLVFAIVRIALVLAVIVLLPLMLTLLSLVFGKSLAKAADRVRGAGERAVARLDATSRRPLETGDPKRPTRIRVAEPQRVHIDRVETDEERDAVAEEEAREFERWRRR